MKVYAVFLALAAAANAQTTRLPKQTTVSPGKQAEIVISMPKPRPSLIDILLRDLRVQVSVILPDGREVKEEVPEADRPSLYSLSDEMSGSAPVKDLLVAGPGLHVIFTITADLPS